MFMSIEEERLTVLRVAFTTLSQLVYKLYVLISINRFQVPILRLTCSEKIYIVGIVKRNKWKNEKNCKKLVKVDPLNLHEY